jgi:sulfur-oxidizing protein SoxY
LTAASISIPTNELGEIGDDAALIARSLPMPSRRRSLQHAAIVAGLLATAGLLPGPARAERPQSAFDAKSLNEVLKALGAAAPVQSKAVTLSGPDIAEDGGAVSLTLACNSPDVKQMLLLIEKNPNLLSAIFEPGTEVEPAFITRVKMAQSSNVYAVAILGDGKVLFAVKDIRITLGACG